MRIPALYLILVSTLLGACTAPQLSTENPSMTDFLVSPIRETVHRDSDDLLSAGLGLAGLRGLPIPFAHADAPTPLELRRRAIWSNWRGIADLGPLGGYGEVYGGAPNVPGREFQAFARIKGAHSPHRVLVQLPDQFDPKSPCVVVTASSGSRGIYGSISLAGAWGLPRGCAVAYTDKAAGTGYFDLDSGSGVLLDGTRAKRGGGMLEFDPDPAAAGSHGVAIKHAHSGDNPEADWGRHVLQAAQFALAMLDRAYPQHAPFTPANTRVIAAGLSNGAGAVLQAAGLDEDGLLDAVIAVAPNVFPGEGGRSLYDYATEAGLLQACALLDPRYEQVPFARVAAQPTPVALAQCAKLAANATVPQGDVSIQAAAAREILIEHGWTDAAMAAAATSSTFDLWQAVGVTYASAYLRSGAGAMPCGYSFGVLDSQRHPVTATAAAQAAWWADASGIAPGAGVEIVEPPSQESGRSCPQQLRDLWTGNSAQSVTLQQSIEATRARLPRAGLPIMVIHGRDDGLIPAAFSSMPYVAWLRANDRRVAHWQVDNAQHFDTFLALPGFGDHYVPMLAYAYRGLERLAAHLDDSSTTLEDAQIAARPRGAGVLTMDVLQLP